MSTAASEPPGDWTARYAEYLSQASSRAARTAELNSRLLKRIARGELTPTILERRYAAFAGTHGAAYANDVAAASMRFLTGLVRAGTGYANELVQHVAPGSSAAEPGEPPSFASADWSTGLRRLTDYAATENATIAALLRTLMDQVASGAVDPADMQAAAEDFHADHLPQTVREIVSLFFDLLTGLDETHADFGIRYLDEVLGLAPDTDRASATVDVVGPTGGSATARLAVSNDAAGPTALRVVMTDVRRADGIGPAFEPDVTIVPERLTLPPGAEEQITLTIRLDAAVFEPGPEYIGTLHVLSPGETLLAVPLRIRAAIPADRDRP
jgi:hypothetical protein